MSIFIQQGLLMSGPTASLLQPRVLRSQVISMAGVLQEDQDYTRTMN